MSRLGARPVPAIDLRHELDCAMAEIERLERLVDIFRERSELCDYWQSRCRVLENDNVKARLEIARLDMTRG